VDPSVAIAVIFFSQGESDVMMQDVVCVVSGDFLARLALEGPSKFSARASHFSYAVERS